LRGVPYTIVSFSFPHAYNIPITRARNALWFEIVSQPFSTT